MPNNLTASDLQCAPYTIRSIKQGHALTRANGRFQALVKGRCLLNFPENVVLSFDWVAVGQSDDDSVEFSVNTRRGSAPHLDGANLVDGNGFQLGWAEQEATLIAVVETINWSQAVKDALVNICVIGADI